MLILIPLGLIIGFILSCFMLKCCKKTEVDDVKLKISEEESTRAEIDYS